MKYLSCSKGTLTFTLENIIFTIQIWGAPKLMKVFGMKLQQKNHLWFAYFEHSLFCVTSQSRRIQWIKHLRICRIRGIACSHGNYFLSRREIPSQSTQPKECIFSHWMYFFTSPAEAWSNNTCHFWEWWNWPCSHWSPLLCVGGPGGKFYNQLW